MAGTGAAAAAAAAAIANAIKASGAIIEVEPDTFMKILSRERDNRPLVIFARGGLIKANYHYLTAHRGFIFSTKSGDGLMLPGNVDIISAKKVWIPG